MASMRELVLIKARNVESPSKLLPRRSKSALERKRVLVIEPTIPATSPNTIADPAIDEVRVTPMRIRTMAMIRSRDS